MKKPRSSPGVTGCLGIRQFVGVIIPTSNWVGGHFVGTLVGHGRHLVVRSLRTFELAQVYLLTQKSATCQTINLYTAGKLGEKLAGKRIEDFTSFNKLAKKISFPNTQWGWSIYLHLVDFHGKCR